MRRATLLFCALFVACGQSDAPTRGVPVKFEAACDKANEGKRLMVEGYVDFPLSVDDKASSVMMRVRPRLATWENTVGANAVIGNGVNSVEMPPANYKNRDLRLHLADGRLAGYANKVKVSGTMFYTTGQAPGAYTCGLKNTLYELGDGFQPAPPK